MGDLRETSRALAQRLEAAERRLADLSAAEETSASLSVDLQRSQDEVQQLQDIQGQLTAKLAAAEAVNAELPAIKASLEGLAVHLERSQEQVDREQAAREALEAQLEGERTDAAERLAASDAEVKQLLEALEHANAELCAAKNEASKQESALNAAKDEASKLESALNAAKDEVSKLESAAERAQDLEAANQDLRRQLEDTASQRKEQDTAQIDELEAEVQNLQWALDAAAAASDRTAAELLSASRDVEGQGRWRCMKSGSSFLLHKLRRQGRMQRSWSPRPRRCDPRSG